MAKYIVKETSFIDGRIVNEGDQIDYAGEPGRNLEAVDGAAKKVVAALPLDQVAALVSAVRINAASRGASPDDANAGDLAAVVAETKPSPTKDVIDKAAVALGLEKAPLV